MHRFILALMMLLPQAAGLFAQGLTISTGHISQINDIRFSEDGRYMLTAGADNTTVLWDLASGREIRTFAVKETGMVYAYFVPGKKQVLTKYYMQHSSGEPAYVACWDMVSGKKLWETQVALSGGLTFSADGSRFTTMQNIDYSQELAWFNTADGKAAEKWKSETIAFAPDAGPDGYLLSWNKHGKGLKFSVAVREMSTGNETAKVESSFNSEVSDMQTCTLSPDKKLLAIAESNHRLQIWDIERSKLIADIKVDMFRLKKLLISPGNKWVVGVAGRGHLFLANIANAKVYYQEGKDEHIYDATFTPDGKYLVTAENDCRKIYFRKPGDRQIVRTISGHSSSVHDIRFSADEKHIVTSHSYEGAKAWDVKTGQFYGKLPVFVSEGLAKNSNDKNLYVRDQYRQVPGVLTRDQIYENYGIVISRKTQKGLLLMAVDSTDWLIFDEQNNFDGSPGALKQLYTVKGLQINNDISSIMATHYKPGLFTSTLYGTASPAAVKKNAEQAPAAGCARIITRPIADDDPSPELSATIVKSGMELPYVKVFLNGREIVSDARQHFTAYNTESLLDDDSLFIKVPLRKYAGTGLVMWGRKNNFEIKVYTDDERSVCGTADVYFTPAYYKQPRLIVPAGHTGWLNDINISPDGRYVVTGQVDAKLWDAATGRELRTFKNAEGQIWYTGLSADGKHLLIRSDYTGNSMLMTISPKYVTRMWNTETGAEEKEDFPDDPFATFSTDGKYVISIKGKTVKELASGKLFALPDIKNSEICDVALAADGKTAAISAVNEAGSQHGAASLLLWDLVQQKEKNRFGIKSAEANKTFIAPSGNWLISQEAVRENREIKGAGSFTLWKAGSANAVRSFSFPRETSIADIRFSAAEDSIYAVAKDGEIVAWSIADGKHLVLAPADTGISAIYRFSGDGNFLLKGRSDGKTEMLLVRNGHSLRQFRGAAFISDHNIISKEHNLLLLSSRNGGLVKHFAYRPGEDLLVFPHSRNVADLSYSTDERYVLTREEDGNAYVWNTEDGRLLRTLSEDGATILRAQFTGDGERVFLMTSKLVGGRYTVKTVNIETGATDRIVDDEEWYRLVSSHPLNRKFLLSADGAMIRVQNHLTHETVTYFTPLDSTDWVMSTEDGYYMSSRRGAQKLYFEGDGKTYLFDQFDLRFNRPDKVLERMGADNKTVEIYRRAYEKRITKMGFTPGDFEKQLMFNVPQIHIVPGSSSRESNVYTFSITAGDSLYLLDRILLSVNGVPVNGAKGISLKSEQRKSLTRKLSVDLSDGSNLVAVSVMNEKGQESLSEQFELSYQSPVRKRDLYIVAIGAGSYASKDKQLAYAAKDAEDIIKLFNSKKGKYDHIFPVLITGTAVTREQIIQQTQLLSKSKVDDDVIIFYAGHGMFDKKKDYYLGCYNTDFTKPETASLAYDQLESLLENVPSRNKILFMDACHSGELDKEITDPFSGPDVRQKKIPMTRSGNNNSLVASAAAGISPFDLMKNVFIDLRKTSGATIIAASGALEFAREDPARKNGVFTYCLIQGLREQKADWNKDGQVALSELQRYLQLEVPQLTNGQQRPVFRTENLYRDVVL